MREEILKIDLDQIDKVRLTCTEKACNFSMDIPLSKVKNDLQCKVCNRPFFGDSNGEGRDQIVGLQKAIAFFKSGPISFILSDPGRGALLVSDQAPGWTKAVFSKG
jgi:hypothetical protein